MSSWSQSWQRSDEPAAASWRLHWLRRALSKRSVTATASLLFLGCLFFFAQQTSLKEAFRKQNIPPSGSPSPLPPLYPQYREYERQLPQHDLNLPYPEGRTGKYFFIANHCRRSGWGNVLQEQVFHAYLTELTDRGFVFDDYTWADDGSTYSSYNGSLIPSKIPETALIQGPMVGTRLGPNTKIPRAISSEHFHTICPNPTRIQGQDVLDGMDVRWGTAREITVAFVEFLDKIEDRCVEVTADSWNIYDLWLLGDGNRLLDIWPDLSKSQTITEFGWSPLIELAFDNNRATISPNLQYEPPLTTDTTILSADRYPMIPGLLVMHIRRGDFEQHCMDVLAHWRSGWLGLNSFPEFPDKFDAPTDQNSEEYTQYYKKHCYPSIEQIVEKVEDVRRTHTGRTLQNIFIMTNGRRPWVADLKEALHRTGGWESISSSRDMELDWEQKFVAQAVDMLVGQRAEVFIGNGWSSLTACITMLRMAYHYSPESIRFF